MNIARMGANDSQRSSQLLAKGLAYLPFGLLLMVGCYACYSFGLSSGAYQFQAQNYAQREQRETTPRVIRECFGLEPGPFTKCLDERIEASAQNQREAYNLAAQQKVARTSEFVFGLGIFELALTLWGILVLRDQLVANVKATEEMGKANRISEETAEKTLNETKRIGEAQARAYLSVSACSVMFSAGRPSVKPTFRNSGQSPALKVRWQARLSLMPVEPQPNLRVAETTKDFRTMRFQVPAQGEREALYCHCDDFELGPAEAAAFAKNVNVAMTIAVTVSGKDVFGENVDAEQSFIQVFRSSPPNLEEIKLDPTGEIDLSGDGEDAG